MRIGLIESDKLFYNMLVSILLTMMLVKTTTGFLCYKCSYSIWSTGSPTICIDDPESLGYGNKQLECNSTSYCVFSERYRLSDQKIVSFFRTCSGVSWGNQCDPSASHLTCKGSCQGDYCNRNDRGDRHVTYLETHKGNIFGNHAVTFDMKSTLRFALCAVLVSSFM